MKEFDINSFFDSSDDDEIDKETIQKNTPTRSKREIETHWTYSLMVYYTPEFAAVEDDIEDFIDEMIAETNQGYLNSKLPITLTKFCSELATLSEHSVANSFELFYEFEKMKGSSDALRNTADAATLLYWGEDWNDICGMANNLRAYSTGKTFSIVRKNCAIGYYSTGHELAHNLGAAHNREYSRNVYYRYGYGHLIKKGKYFTGLRSIMSYKRRGHETRVNYYSNPDVLHPLTGTPTGVRGRSNNAAVIRENIGKLAAIGDESGTCGHACDPGWTYFEHTAKCYRFLRKKITFYEAANSCFSAAEQSRRTARLASIHDETTNKFLTSLSKRRRAWIGGYRTDKKYVWMFDFSSWNYESLNPYANWETNERYLVTNVAGPGLWSFAPSGAKVGALCQY